ncbi:uncharacterized protein C8R40DRAFT_638791 [Lentinula edodes]|uniref:uncharacterized protein n=1 Tax=Lentinula edodes TaxID=5353 RepID=UPI001E8DBE04|nr:uncharacterized protein C8R40DRAFT_638791 [Lentinula edodes]KAH7870465.1 hypothetical protein C8R40DRAFT_638791 [Lentinula edodes]
MLLTISGQPCIAGKDITIYQSVVSRSFVRAANLGNWHNDFVSATVNFGLNNFGYTLPIDFIVVNDVAGFDAIFGVDFQHRCRSSDCVRIFDNLPFVQSSLEARLPLPILPHLTGQYAVNPRPCVPAIQSAYSSLSSSTFPRNMPSNNQDNTNMFTPPSTFTSQFAAQNSASSSSRLVSNPQISFVMNNIGSSPAGTPIVSNPSINEPGPSQRALYVGGPHASEDIITNNLVSPNGCSAHNELHNLINREKHTVTSTASTSEYHPVVSALPTSNDVLTACLFDMLPYMDWI